MINFLFGLGAGIVAASVIWYFVLRNNRNKLAQFIDVPEAMWEKVKQEVDEFDDDVKDKLQNLFNKK